MSFHPRMFSQVKGFRPLNDVASLSFKDVVLDYWNVDSQLGAHGRYVSVHPRLVFILDDRDLLLMPKLSAGPQPAAAFYIPAGYEIHSRVKESGTLRHLDVHLSVKRLKAILGSGVSVHAPHFLGCLGDARALVEILVHECQNPQRCDDHVMILVKALILEHFRNAANQQDSAGRIDAERLKAAVLENASRRMSMHELAHHFGLSRSQFTRVFRSQHGQSPKQWITDLKVEEAKSWLLQGHRIVEVADQFGFADQSHFSRVFRSKTGQTPKAWMNGAAHHGYAPNLQDTL